MLPWNRPKSPVFGFVRCFGHPPPKPTIAQKKRKTMSLNSLAPDFRSLKCTPKWDVVGPRAQEGRRGTQSKGVCSTQPIYHGTLSKHLLGPRCALALFSILYFFFWPAKSVPWDTAPQLWQWGVRLPDLPHLSWLTCTHRHTHTHTHTGLVSCAG